MVKPEIKARIKNEMPELLYRVSKNIGDHFKCSNDPIPDCTIVGGKWLVKKHMQCKEYSVTFTIEIQVDNTI